MNISLKLSESELTLLDDLTPAWGLETRSQTLRRLIAQATAGNSL